MILFWEVKENFPEKETCAFRVEGLKAEKRAKRACWVAGWGLAASRALKLERADPVNTH